MTHYTSSRYFLCFHDNFRIYLTELFVKNSIEFQEFKPKDDNESVCFDFDNKPNFEAAVSIISKNFRKMMDAKSENKEPK